MELIYCNRNPGRDGYTTRFEIVEGLGGPAVASITIVWNCQAGPVRGYYSSPWEVRAADGTLLGQVPDYSSLDGPDHDHPFAMVREYLTRPQRIADEANYYAAVTE
jgi:hypothetical protein